MPSILPNDKVVAENQNLPVSPRIYIEPGNPIAKIVKDTKFWHSDKRI